MDRIIGNCVGCDELTQIGDITSLVEWQHAYVRILACHRCTTLIRELFAAQLPLSIDAFRQALVIFTSGAPFFETYDRCRTAVRETARKKSTRRRRESLRLVPDEGA